MSHAFMKRGDPEARDMIGRVGSSALLEWHERLIVPASSASAIAASSVGTIADGNSWAATATGRSMTSKNEQRIGPDTTLLRCRHSRTRL